MSIFNAHYIHLTRHTSFMVTLGSWGIGGGYFRHWKQGATWHVGIGPFILMRCEVPINR